MSGLLVNKISVGQKKTLRHLSLTNTVGKLHAHIEEDEKLAKTVAKTKSGYDTRPPAHMTPYPKKVTEGSNFINTDLVKNNPSENHIASLL